MGVFSYEGGIMRVLTRIANMMIVSFFWILGSLPVITVLPACAALYHTTVKIIRGSGSGVAHDFWKTWAGNLRQGIPLTLFALVFGGILGYCLYFGYHNAVHGWVLAYFLIGCVLALALCCMVLWAGLVLSRFQGGLGTMVRLALYFAMGHPLANLLLLVLLLLVAFLVDFNPLLALILPAVWMDLAAGSIEKAFSAFQEAQQLSEPDAEGADDDLPQAAEPSNLEQAKALEADTKQ